MIDKHAKPTKLFWVDLEMTGLDAAHDVILEVAAEVTDFDFKKLASYEARIKHQHETVAARMKQNAWWDVYPKNRDDFLQKLDEGKSLGDVEQELIALLKKHIGDELVILAGNSIHSDRAFIKRWWPELDRKLHYRMLDVTSLKVFMQGKYGLEFKKQETHRAYDDIQESIAEWQYYLDWLREHPNAQGFSLQIQKFSI
jgi:oligoribonuclease